MHELQSIASRQLNLDTDINKSLLSKEARICLNNLYLEFCERLFLRANFKKNIKYASERYGINFYWLCHWRKAGKKISFFSLQCNKNVWQNCFIAVLS